MIGLIALAAVLAGMLILVISLLLGTRKRLARFSGITDAEAQQAAVQAETRDLESITAATKDTLVRLQHEHANLDQAHQARVARLDAELQQLLGSQKEQLAALQQELSGVEEAIEVQSFGFYRPHYGFESSDEYKIRLQHAREEQKNLVKRGKAAYCPTEWSVEGSASKGRKMVKEHMKLMLRAFNGECDAAVAKVKYNNVTNLEARINKSFEALNKLGKSKQISITPPYLQQKLAELQLVHEHREKVQEEKEEQRRIKEQMREEQKATKEIDKAQQDAEKEEARNQLALEKARRELAASTGRQHDKLERLVGKLELELTEAIDKKAKSIARAQLTKSGHVYVISNIGSFGESFFKIGMTRRLEPLDRVKELGDASVPFKFDVHAMIYSENAPALENALHREFATRRVNKINLRREFFRVSLDEIRLAVARNHGIITFVTVPAAEEYRKTAVMEQDMTSQQSGLTQAGG